MFVVKVLIVIFINRVSAAPFYYTPYVEKCDYHTARNSQPKPKADSLFGQHPPYNGYFTVNKQLDANLFTFFFRHKNTTAPFIVWIQGQPGCTSLYAVLGQNGPFRIHRDGNVTKNQYAWTNMYNVLYLDSMVFTGYSYAKDPINVVPYLRNIGHHLYQALSQFYEVFPEMLPNDLYLAGEMYAGKYLLLLAETIHKRNPISYIKMPLKGLYIGSGLTDPVNMMTYSALLYQIGMIDHGTMKDMENIEETIRKGIRAKQYATAQQQFNTIRVMIQNLRFTNPMDFTKPNENYIYAVFDYLTDSTFRNQFGLDEQSFYRLDNNITITLENRKPISFSAYLEEDILQSRKDLLPMLLTHYRILYYGAQYDLTVPYVLITNFLTKLHWKGAEKYYNHEKVPRQLWLIDNELAGYWKTVRNLTDVMVRASAQMIDASQPKWAFNLLRNFIENRFRENKSNL